MTQNMQEFYDEPSYRILDVYEYKSFKTNKGYGEIIPIII